MKTKSYSPKAAAAGKDIGKPGKKIYKSETKLPPFAAMELKEKLQTIVLEKRILDRERRQRLNLS